MLNKSKLIKELKEDASKIDKMLHPERHIADFKADDLKINVIPSGFPSLDEYMLLKEGRSELIIIGGRPSHGKSAFMFQLAYNLAQTHGVHVFSLEMDTDQIRTRLLAGKLNKSLNALQKGTVDTHSINLAKEEFSKLSYYIDDRSGLTVFQLCDAVKDAKNKIGTAVIIIDYLQLLNTPKGHSKDAEIGEITRTLKQLAKELRVPIVVGCQLNRNCETRGRETGDFRPCLADLRESGNIEQDADMVLLVHRESRYTGERPGEADILIVKNRNGAVGEVRMQFSENQTRFIDATPEL